ncbi:hypothetical protein BC937DRAFT_86622 [Endogone sp. FLAS-F59071]|nr:hypothetical protein BC937DRAFT_86622 [Endogone sp. FLAS-F59071]|eukprot:RUS12950.1 hypothetical protein BC937DRAFT_86622 [Endogone sp. FLAS-F59071]
MLFNLDGIGMGYRHHISRPLRGRDPNLRLWIKHLPVWCFYGALDNIQPVQRYGNSVTEGWWQRQVYRVPDAGHNSWSQTYEYDKVIQWILEQKRK